MREANEPVPLFSSSWPTSTAARQSRARSCRSSRASRASVSKAVPASALKASSARSKRPAFMKSCASAYCARSRSSPGRSARLEQVLVDANRALVLAATAEQVAEREVQIGGVGVLLDCFDEGVDRLVVLLVEQKVQALVVDRGRIAPFPPPLPQVEPRRRSSRGRRRAAPRSATADQSPSRGGCGRVDSAPPEAIGGAAGGAGARATSRRAMRRCRHQLGTIAKMPRRSRSRRRRGR